jgi:hypothetical protein
VLKSDCAGCTQYLGQNKAKWVTPADQYIHMRASEKDLRVTAPISSFLPFLVLPPLL